MKVRVNESFAEGFLAYVPGDEVELPNDLAVLLLKSGTVERIGVVPEAAVMPSRGEKAVRRAAPAR